MLPCSGNGQLDAVSNAIRKAFNISVKSLVYSEHDLDRDSDSRGIAYFGLTGESGNVSWGAGMIRILLQRPLRPTLRLLIA